MFGMAKNQDFISLNPSYNSEMKLKSILLNTNITTSKIEFLTSFES